MTSPLLDFAELQTLLDAVCDETVTAEQLQRLETLLLAHPEAEAYYVQYMSHHADVVRHFAAEPRTAETFRQRGEEASVEVPAEAATPPAAQAPAPSVVRWSRSTLALAGLAALAAGVLLVLTLVQRRPPEDGGSRPPAQEAVDNTVAVLLRAHKAEWEKTGMPTQVGAALPPGRLRLKSGLAHIQFYSGATVILEGPADFQLISRTEAFCAQGKLRATVPDHAQGFTIGSPTLDLVDRGTEFGLRVDGKRHTEVQVFQGVVEVYDAGADRAAATPKALKKDQGIRVDASGAVQEFESDSASFQTVQQLEQAAQEETEARKEAWRAAVKPLRKDPHLLVFYDFQPQQLTSLTLADQALDRKLACDGTIVGCSWAAGRWPGRYGLEFKSVSDRVRLKVPGTFESITLLAWVRVDALPNGNNSLMMADGWDEGGMHWQIGADGKLILGVRGPIAGKVNGHYHAFNVFTPERFKQWTHLATVYDGGHGTVTHYVDGQLASQDFISVPVGLHVGTAEIGNWNIASFQGKQPIRFFSGCIDEFMLFSRPWSKEEVEQFYEQTRPPW
jgi:hypothetical protein